jgi:signal peptidase I
MLAAKVGLVLVLAVIVLRFVVTYRTVRVPEKNDQMAPVLRPGSRVMVHLGYDSAAEFERGDILAYAVRAPGSGRAEVRFGRAAGLPGDRVEVRGPSGPGPAEVLVNGEPARYGPVLGTPDEAGGETGEIRPRTVTVPEGAVFVLNDRAGSELEDSRAFGPLAESAVVGKVVTTSW